MSWIIHGFCGPGRGLKELRELAASESACSILDAANDAAWTESKICLTILVSESKNNIFVYSLESLSDVCDVCI